MQIDLSQELPRPPPYTGWLEKKGSLRKNWKNRYFLLDGGTLRYFAKGPPKGSEVLEGTDMKGDIPLLGADIQVSEGLQINIISRDKKGIVLKAKNNKEANEWHGAIIRQIRFQNTLALRNASRLPEVMEWYYQLQSELTRKYSFLLKGIEANLSTDSSGTGCLYRLSMTEDHSGLLLTLLTGGRKPTRGESLNNGRVVLFGDILSVNLPQGWALSASSRFVFVLETKEDSFSLDMDALGVTWLQAVRDMVLFTRIPTPSGRISTVDRNSVTMSALVEFSANSSVVFTEASDVTMIIEGLGRVAGKSPCILDIGARIHQVLRCIPDCKSNKEAVCIFGERVEEITRVLGDPDVGILYLSRESDRSLLNFHLSTFHGKLADVLAYLASLSTPGWLSATITSKQTTKARLEALDNDLISIINTLIKAMAITQAVLFEKRDYTCAVDIRKSVEALGGVEAVYRDKAKERALAKLLQSDGNEVHKELEEFIRNAEAGNNRTSRASRVSYDSYRTSSDTTHTEASWFRRYFCCCCPRAGPVKAKKVTSGKKGGKIQLEEPLIT